MNQLSLKRENLDNLLDTLKGEYKIFAPVLDDSDVILSELKSETKFVFDYSNFTISPKGLFFPQSEGIVSFLESGAFEPSVEDKKRLLFGCRPCDASALLHLDRVFLEGIFQDPGYKQKRQNTLIISLSCESPLETCFCLSLDGGPYSRKGSDILIFEMDDSLLFEVCSEKGEEFARNFAYLFSAPEKKEKEVAAEISARIAKLAKNQEKISLTEEKKEILKSLPWDLLTRRCLSCGVCTYLCPTCHCFAFFDEGTYSAGKRIRDWDSCMFSEFAREASGHNPRMRKGERMRQRVMHKFVYTDVNFGETFCVGCGRCVRSCPANMDIREILKRGL